MLSSSSWGCELKYDYQERKLKLATVILFVRMWVEINLQSLNGIKVHRHPLREDVSWNVNATTVFPFASVILFVRMWVEIPLRLYGIPPTFCHPLRGDVSWNIQNSILKPIAKVILFVRMWVEIPLSYTASNYTVSSSSWGCELKYYKLQWYFSASTCHPLREDVSWNLDTVLSNLTSPIRHPLREDVSWNRLAPVIEEIGDVILFVRMWVEIRRMVMEYVGREGHPLREDVSWNLLYLFRLTLRFRHPLREDVSWNIRRTATRKPVLIVILFVRMWVEIRKLQISKHLINVILFVRMWVEMIRQYVQWKCVRSSSSWGCELKSWRVRC